MRILQENWEQVVHELRQRGALQDSASLSSLGTSSPISELDDTDSHFLKEVRAELAQTRAAHDLLIAEERSRSAEEVARLLKKCERLEGEKADIAMQLDLIQADKQGNLSEVLRLQELLRAERSSQAETQGVLERLQEDIRYCMLYPTSTICAASCYASPTPPPPPVLCEHRLWYCAHAGPCTVPALGLVLS